MTFKKKIMIKAKIIHRKTIQISWFFCFVSFAVMMIANCNTIKRTTHKDVTTVKENNAVVAAFVTYVRANNYKVPDHEYIKNALVKSADAVIAIAKDVNYPLGLDVNKIKEYATRITQDPTETTHANNIRKAADLLSAALKNLQLTRYHALSVPISNLQTSAEAIQPGVLVHNQKEAIATFLNNTAGVLEKMN